MKKIHVIAAAVLVAAICFAGAETASADTTTCPSTYACVWKDSSYRTSGNTLGYLKFAKYIPRFSSWDYNGTNDEVHDDATSAKNNGQSQAAVFFKDVNCSGSAFTLARGANDGDFRNGSPSGSFNDELDSGSFTGYLTSC